MFHSVCTVSEDHILHLCSESKDIMYIICYMCNKSVHTECVSTYQSRGDYANTVYTTYEDVWAHIMSAIIRFSFYLRHFFEA